MRMLARRCRVVAAAAVALLSLLATGRVQAMPGDHVLPAPSISRALDAVLMPVDEVVVDAFGLPSDAFGVLVLAVQPGGIADAYGIEPGDVLYGALGRPIRDPRHLDALVLRTLRAGGTDFAFDLYRDDILYVIETLITIEYYEEIFVFEEVWTWESWSYESFSYTEYFETYSETIETSFYEEEILIEEESYEEEIYEEGTYEEEIYDETTELSEETAEEELFEEEAVEEETFVDDGSEGEEVYESEDLVEAGDEEELWIEEEGFDDGGFEDDAGFEEESFEAESFEDSGDDAFIEE